MNRSLTSDREHQDMWYVLSKAYYDLLQKLLVRAGLEADVYGVLEPMCLPNSYPVLEKRKAAWVKFYVDALLAGVDTDTLPDINECEIGVVDLEFSATTASLTTAMAGANNDIVLTSTVPGSAGNSRSFRLVDPAGNDQVLAVTTVGDMVSVSLATDAGGVITTTATQLLAALAASGAASSLMTGSLAAGNTGAGVVTALAQTYLTGGAE